MKELHNHIFSNTTCISKENMLRYINKQLSKKELHDVEKHMLDCELCTDAFEGMKMATNSSMLFAIDSKIDLRSGGGAKKSPVMRNLMVAASIMIIVFGAYFTVNNFNQNLAEADLAINEIAEEKTIPSAPENFISEEINDEENVHDAAPVELTSEVTAQEELNNVKQITPVVLSDAEREEVVIANDEVVTDVTVTLADEYNMDLDEVESITEEVEFADRLSENAPSTTNTANNRNDNNTDVSGNTSSTKASGYKYSSKAEEQKSAKPKNKKKDKAKRKKMYSASFSEPAVSKDANLKTRQNTYTIYSYKVYDYAVEYQNDYDFKKDAELESVAPDFANEEDKGVAEKELEKSTIEITYKETLEEGVHYLKESKYQLAISQFNIILKEHPKDINALFYGGISQYHLTQYDAAYTKFNKTLANKNTVFDQEAKWYKALSLVALKKGAEAKIVLQEIIDEAGFYKDQATEKLKEFE